MPANRLKRILLPFLLTLFILLLDQISKALIVSHIRLHTVGFQVFGDFLRIIHARNPGIAFSIGHGMGTVVRLLFFSLIPVAVLGLVIVFYIRTDFLTPLQRWAVAGVIGEGWAIS